MTEDVTWVRDFARRTLEGERVRLRPVTDDDLVLMDRWWNTPEILPLQTSTLLPRPEGKGIERMRGWLSNEKLDSVGFAVERRDDGELLGHVTLFGASLGNLCATFAIQLRPDLTGQGYGTEATRMMVDYGFSVLPLHRIELQVYGYNDRARHAYAKAGFVEEGARREAAFLDGRWHDEVTMSILRHEWEARRRG